MTSRAEQLINRADAVAEGLIGGVRMVAAAVLGLTLFLLIRRLDLPEHVFPVTLALALVLIGLFFLVGAISALVVVSGRYRPWMSWAFGLVDVSVIVLNMFLQLKITGASPQAALSSPTSFMILLVLVMQTLRFRVRLHLGLSAVLVLAIGFIVFGMPGEADPDATAEHLVRFFSPLPNIVRLVMIFLIAAIAGVAVWQGRFLLKRVAQETEIRTNQMRFLPRELSDAMTDADLEAMRKGRRADVAIMFVDVRGFTALSERKPPEETARLLSELRGIVAQSVLPHGGVIDKFIGDGALIVFGLATDLREACAGALEAGSGILDNLRSWNDRRLDEEPIRLVVSIHAGPVIAGALGDDLRLEFSVVGAPVNEASRIESVAKDRDMAFVVSEPVLRAAQVDLAGWEDLKEVPLRGASAPIQLYGRR